MQDSCKYIEKAAVNSQQGRGTPVRVLGRELTTPHHKKTASYEIFHRASDLAGYCEHGNEPSGSMKGGEFLD
jgi:hypothetical protein